MQTRKEGRSYILYHDGVKRKVNAKKMDAALEGIRKHLQAVADILEDADYDTARILTTYCLEYLSDDFSEGKSWRINCSIDTIKELQEQLKSDDKIPEEKKIKTLHTLEDEGYVLWSMPDDKKRVHYEKPIENTRDVEVTYEAILPDNILRKRTTFWEKTDYGRTSTEIKYQNMKVSKKMEKIMNDTYKTLFPENEEE